MFVIASEAKQSSATAARLDCFVASAPRNDELKNRTTVIPAKAGIQYAAASRMRMGALEYWVPRFRGG
jgi:hypothetical protein